MTIILPPTRALSQHLLSRSHPLLARATLTANSLLRVHNKHNVASLDSERTCDISSAPFSSLLLRSYATAASAKPLGRPKGHTGRAPAKRKPAAKNATTGTKKAPKKAAPRKPKAKAKPKPKPKPRKKKVISVAGQKRLDAQKAKALKEKALLKPPKKLPETAWTLIFTESSVKGSPIDGNAAKSAAQKYKNLSAEEHERYNHTATENKKKNVTDFKRWLSTYTPLQIKEANNARNMLRQQAKKAGKKTQYSHIQDDRLVKQARTPYTYFLQARVSSGDMKNMKIGEIGGLVAREWKGLSAAEKKTYEDMGAKDKTRYHEEYKSVYGVDPPFAQKTKKS